MSSYRYLKVSTTHHYSVYLDRSVGTSRGVNWAVQKSGTDGAQLRLIHVTAVNGQTQVSRIAPTPKSANAVFLDIVDNTVRISLHLAVPRYTPVSMLGLIQQREDVQRRRKLWARTYSLQPRAEQLNLYSLREAPIEVVHRKESLSRSSGEICGYCTAEGVCGRELNQRGS